ncbi:hypothetical protein CONPUDRAFT_164407, partial [Coniophora puteana RWD-64-598 SS2]
MDESSLQWVVAQRGKQTTAYANIAGFALLVYDYYLTIDQEVDLVWTRRWDLVQVVFMLARYLPFPAIALTVVRVLETVRNGPCPNLEGSNVSHLLSILLAEILLILRTLAFWEGSKRMAWALTIFALFCLGGAVGFTQLAFIKVPGIAKLPLSQCEYRFNPGGAVQYGVLLFHEIVILCVILYRWFTYHHRARSRVVVISYIDAVLYICAVICLSVASIVTITTQPPYHTDYFDNLQVVGHTIFCTRTFFHLRKSAQYISRRVTTETSLEDLTV